MVDKLRLKRTTASAPVSQQKCNPAGQGAPNVYFDCSVNPSSQNSEQRKVNGAAGRAQ